MTIVFFSNFINHHNIGFSDYLYDFTSGGFYYVCTHMIPDSYVKSGYPNYFDRPYVIKAFEDNGFQEAKKLAVQADIAIFGGNQELNQYRIPRLKLDKLSFECGERWFKKGWINVFSPQLIITQFFYHTLFRKCKNYYALNASAFGVRDYSILHSFEGKCFKWGYFTQIKEFDIQSKIFTGSRLMWVNRFIKWKHPEIPIIMAKRLKDEGYTFILDMYGRGELETKMMALTQKLGVEDCVIFHGSIPNADILSEMRSHDIVLTTSDQNEGWGAVVNEAMSNGCVLIGSNKVGAVPFLIEDGVNGLVFKSNRIESLLVAVKRVIAQPDKCKILAENAYETIRDVWSPENAARNLYKLSLDLLNNKRPSIENGPCSTDE